MKQTWKKPTLEVLDVSMTMKGWPGGGDEGADGGGNDPEDPENPFDS